MRAARLAGRRDTSARALLRGARGGTAMEFAIVSLPFFTFVLFLFELGVDFYLQLALDYAVQQGARRLQTGAGNAAPSAAAFKADCMCPLVAGFLNCSQISINVHPLATADYYANGLAGGGSVPLVGGKLSTTSWSFNAGSATTPMFLQAIYTSASVVGQLVPGMATNSGNGWVRVTSSAIGFINEPFTSPSTICGAP